MKLKSHCLFHHGLHSHVTHNSDISTCKQECRSWLCNFVWCEDPQLSQWWFSLCGTNLEDWYAVLMNSLAGLRMIHSSRKEISHRTYLGHIRRLKPLLKDASVIEFLRLIKENFIHQGRLNVSLRSLELVKMQVINFDSKEFMQAFLTKNW